MEYYSINFYSVSEKTGEVWIEKTEAENNEEAEHLLARNNAQLILSEEEFRRLFEKMAKELEDQESWTPGDLKKLYPYPCADFRVKKSDNEEVTYLHIRIPLNEATAKADFKRCTNIRETSDGIRSTPEKTRKVD